MLGNHRQTPMEQMHQHQLQQQLQQQQQQQQQHHQLPHHPHQLPHAQHQHQHQHQHQRANATMDALTKLRQAERKVIDVLQHCAASLRALSTSVDGVSTGAGSTAIATDDPPPAFEQHMDMMLSNLLEVQTLVRERIQHVGADLPFENVTLRRLIESDLAIQRTAHIHRALVYTLTKLGEAPIGDASTNTNTTAPSPPYMPSPVMATMPSTPLTAFGGPVTSSPSSAQQPITLSVRSPDGAATIPPQPTALAGQSQLQPSAPQQTPLQSQPQPPQPPGRQGPPVPPDRNDMEL